MKIPRTCIPCEKIEDDCYDWYARHRAKLAETESKKADILFIGDSITHFWGPEDGIGYGREVWEEFYGNRQVLNLGFGFDRTQNMLWRLRHGEAAGQKPKLIVVNAGTNQFAVTPNYDGDTPEEAFEGVKKLVVTLRAMFPESELVVMALFPRFSDELRKRIDKLNLLLREYLEEASAKDPLLKFLDISSRFLLPDGTFNTELFIDRRCHPNCAGYRIWAEALEPEIRRILSM